MMRIFLARRWSWVGLALIALFAVGVRFYQLTEIPHTLWADEAWFEVRGREVLSGEAVWPRVDPVFAIGNSPFQTYLTALVQALGWPVAYSARVMSALTGALSVLLMYPFLRALFASWPETPRAVAALAGTACLATTFALLLFSRDGTQNTGCVLFTLLVMWGLYRSLTPALSQRQRLSAALLSGLALAIALTTYEAAYALPIVIVLVALAHAFTTGQWRLAFTQTALIALTAALILSPLLVFYVFNPEVILNRVQEAQSGNVLNPLVGFARVWLGVLWEGDALFGQNLSGRPLFDVFNAALFLCGGLLAVRVWRTPTAQLLLITALVLALPSALTQNPPAFTRMLPMLPALAGLVAWGAGAVWEACAVRGRPFQMGAVVVLTLGFGLSGVLTAYDYFGRWANDPRLFDARQMGARLLAEQALAAAQASEVFVTPRSQPLVYYTYQAAFADTPVQTLDPTLNCFPLAHQRATLTTYALTLAFDDLTLPLLKTAYPSGHELPPVFHPQGYAYGLSFQVPAHTPAPLPEYAVAAQFEGGLRLVGYDFSHPVSAKPGAELKLLLHWETDGPLTDSALTSFVHVGRGRDSHPLLAQSDGPLCSSFAPERWQAGFRYIEVRALSLPAEVPLGDYDMRVGVYEANTQIRLNVQAAVPVEDNRVVLTTFKVEP